MTKAPPKPPRTFASGNSGQWVLNGTSNSFDETGPSHSSVVIGNSSLTNGSLTTISESTRNPSSGFVGLNSGINSTSQTIRTSSRGSVGPPKPPRTFEYVMVDSASYSYDLNCLSSPDEYLLSPNEFMNNGKSIVCKSFVDNSNPIKVTTNACVSYSSAVTYLQDKSCLTLCNGFYDPKPESNGILQRSGSYKSSNSYSRCFSEEKISFNKLNKSANKFEQKSFSLGRNVDLKRGFNSEEMSIHTDQKVVIRRSRGNRNKSKRQAMYWDEDETSRLLQFSHSCPDIPDTSVSQKTQELDNGVLETWL